MMRFDESIFCCEVDVAGQKILSAKRSGRLVMKRPDRRAMRQPI